MQSRRTPALRALLLTALVAAVALSGCASGPNKAKAQPDEPTVTADKGAITGFILSLDELPLAVADVLVRGPVEKIVQSDAAGQYIAGQLPPGDYVVVASKIGFQNQQARTTVRAADTSHVTLHLPELQLEGVAYKVRLDDHGKFFCGWAALRPAGPCKFIGFADETNPVEQAWAQVSGNENNLFEYRTLVNDTRVLKSDQLVSAVVEIKWTMSSAGSKWLQATIEDLPEDEGARNLSEPLYAHVKGESALKMVLTPGVKHATGETAMPTDHPGFLIGVFPTTDPDAPDVPVNQEIPGVACVCGYKVSATVYLEQTFDVSITLFYNEPAPADFSALA